MITDRITMELQYNLNVLNKQKEMLGNFQPANIEELMNVSNTLKQIEHDIADYQMIMMDRIAYIITNGLEDMIL